VEKRRFFSNMIVDIFSLYFVKLDKI
jgi:hypothetical protein